jgi:hypothetical protein
MSTTVHDTPGGYGRNHPGIRIGPSLAESLRANLASRADRYR